MPIKDYECIRHAFERVYQLLHAAFIHLSENILQFRGAY